MERELPPGQPQVSETAEYLASCVGAGVPASDACVAASAKRVWLWQPRGHDMCGH